MLYRLQKSHILFQGFAYTLVLPFPLPDIILFVPLSVIMSMY